MHYTQRVITVYEEQVRTSTFTTVCVYVIFNEAKRADT